MFDPSSRKMELLDIMLSKGVTSASIVGMAKNVGKTVVMNHLIGNAARRGMKLGITSIGRDGEAYDEVFGTPKPRIFAPVGVIVATAATAVGNSPAKIQVLLNTGFSTALGDVVIGCVIESGQVELAGPTIMKQHRLVSAKFRELGADLILTDGAIDRICSASPDLSEVVVLATGAALDANMDVVLRKTKERIEKFSLPIIDPCYQEICRKIMDANSWTALIDLDEKVVILPVTSSIGSGAVLRQYVGPQTRTVVCGGAVGDKVLKSMLECMRKNAGNRLRLVVRNGTHLFCGDELLRKFAKAGGSIEAFESIRTIAITLNPYSPQGTSFDPLDFFEAAVKALAPHTVMDVVAGYCFMEGAGHHGKF